MFCAGMVFIAGFIVILSVLMFFFPKQIKPEVMPPPLKMNIEKRNPFFKGNLPSSKKVVIVLMLIYNRLKKRRRFLVRLLFSVCLYAITPPIIVLCF